MLSGTKQRAKSVCAAGNQYARAFGLFLDLGVRFPERVSNESRRCTTVDQRAAEQTETSKDREEGSKTNLIDLHLTHEKDELLNKDKEGKENTTLEGEESQRTNQIEQIIQ